MGRFSYSLKQNIKNYLKVLENEKQADSEGRRVNTWKKITTLVSLFLGFGQAGLSLCHERWLKFR